MKKLGLITLLNLALLLTLNSQNKKRKDQAAIKDMCGCYEVSFKFAETFNYVEDSLYKPSKTYTAKGLEWAQLVTDNDDKIVIQHILQVGKPTEPMIVKHWRQDWIFENQDLYVYNGDNNWTYEKISSKDVKGQWTQKVFQVDDSPRYEGSGTWVHVDGKSYWENATTAPLPRREYTKRSDYNITMRGNRHEITEYGWLHDQDNQKILREKGKDDVILADEKGINIYKKVDDSRCQAAQDWWKTNFDKWAAVRAKWDEVYKRNQDLTLEAKVDNRVLYKHLFDEEVKESIQINEVIDAFVKL